MRTQVMLVSAIELDNQATRSGALFKPTAPLGVQTMGRSEDEIGPTLQRYKNQSSVGRGSLLSLVQKSRLDKYGNCGIKPMENRVRIFG